MAQRRLCRRSLCRAYNQQPPDKSLMAAAGDAFTVGDLMMNDYPAWFRAFFGGPLNDVERRESSLTSVIKMYDMLRSTSKLQGGQVACLVDTFGTRAPVGPFAVPVHP